MANTERVHALDALRAFALLSGVLLHSTLSYVLPGGAWAVGTTHPAAFPTWLVAYLHAFRLETFFLLAWLLRSAGSRESRHGDLSA